MVRQVRDLELSKRLSQAIAKHRPERIDGCRVADELRLGERLFDERQREGKLLEDECAKPLRDRGSRRGGKGSSHLSKMVAFGGWELGIRSSVD
jgi:hypothetical protein